MLGRDEKYMTNLSAPTLFSRNTHLGNAYLHKIEDENHLTLKNQLKSILEVIIEGTQSALRKKESSNSYAISRMNSSVWNQLRPSLLKLFFDPTFHADDPYQINSLQRGIQNIYNQACDPHLLTDPQDIAAWRRRHSLLPVLLCFVLPAFFMWDAPTHHTESDFFCPPLRRPCPPPPILRAIFAILSPWVMLGGLLYLSHLYRQDDFLKSENERRQQNSFFLQCIFNTHVPLLELTETVKKANQNLADISALFHTPAEETHQQVLQFKRTLLQNSRLDQTDPLLYSELIANLGGHIHQDRSRLSR